ICRLTTYTLFPYTTLFRSMDDDDFRRGKPTNHKVFGEAVAVLAGDALQASAFESLTKLEHTDPANIVELVRLLGKCAGASGMVGDRKSTRLNSSHVKISYA